MAYVTIALQYGVDEVGMVHPGDVNVSVEVNPNAAGCFSVTADSTNCTAIITGDGNYTVALTVTNELGSTRAESTFDCELCTVTVCVYKEYIWDPARAV